MISDSRYMALALSLGRRGLGRVWPNPAVGCVIVNNGRVVGRGWTADGGRPHAEVSALSQAGRKAKGAEVFVTLEPCAHHGQTPPCAQALIDAGVKRVVIAMVDPDPRVDHQGIAMLKSAGISVTIGVCADDAAMDHAGFLSRVVAGRPWVTLKLATTLDGRIATATGESQWITGPEARAEVHRQRASHDAVMVGAGTARADDPTLNVRGLGDVPQPVRVVVSRDLNLPKDGNLVRTAQDQPLWLCHGPAADTAGWDVKGVSLVQCEVTENTVDLGDVLSKLGEKGLTRVFCEGGGALAAGLLRGGLVDQLLLFTGGRLIGGDGLAAVAPFGVLGLSDAPGFRLVETRAIGGEGMQVWRPV